MRRNRATSPETPGDAASALPVLAQACQCSAVSIVRLSTEVLPQSQRASWFSDELGRRLTSAQSGILPDEPHTFHIDWMHAPLPQAVLGRANLTSIYVERTADCIRDGDDDFTYFMPLRWQARWRHNDHAAVVGAGGGMLIAHARPVESQWRRADVGFIRLPRSALKVRRPDALAGRPQAAGLPALRLLRAYYRTVWRMVAAGETPPAMAEQHLAELVAAVVAPPDRPDETAREARLAARIAAMRQVIAARFAEPGLRMADVSAAVGLSTRAGYAALEAAELRFSDLLVGARLERAATMLRADPFRGVLDVALAVGFTDLSHFNRRFRQRFGMTPRDMRDG